MTNRTFFPICLALFIFSTSYVKEKMNSNGPLPVTNPITVNNRLSQLGLNREILHEVIDRMVLARRSVTENHPAGSGGWMAWSEGTARLRELLAPLGFERNDEYHIASAEKDGIRLAVCNTDDGTGILARQPQNRSKKGAGTDSVISLNQGVFGTILEEAENVIQMPSFQGGDAYWLLCVYCEGEVVRAELSCPLECTAGFITSFRERIFLIGEDGDGGGSLIEILPDDGPDLEIQVTRKEA